MRWRPRWSFEAETWWMWLLYGFGVLLFLMALGARWLRGALE